MALWTIWLSIAALLLIIELLSGWIATFCVAVGCFVAAIIDLCGGGLVLQLSGVITGVIIAFIYLAPFVNRFNSRRHRNREAYNSNMDALIGRVVSVTRPIAPERPGRVQIDGDSWQARADRPDESIDLGDTVRVTGYDSIILIVKKVNQ